MTDTLTVSEKQKEVGFSEAQAAALARAIEAAATATAELVEAQMNKDLAAIIERSDAKFEANNAKFEASNAKLEASIEKTARDQTRWFATIVFSAIGLLVAAYGIVSHLK